MEEDKMSLYQQILNDIEDIAHGRSQNYSELKRKITIFIKNQKLQNEGKIKFESIKKIAADLIGIRGNGLENEESINETLQIIAEEYNSMGEKEKEDAKEIYKEILGFAGTDCTKMEWYYLHEIIYKKVDAIPTISTEIKPDIINILNGIFETQNPSIVMNMPNYISVAEDTVIPLIDKDNKELNNKKVLTILKNIAIQYKIQGNYQRAFELCELGGSLEQFKNEPEYSDLTKELESLELYLSLEKNFRSVSINMQNKTLPEAIRDALSEYKLMDIKKGGGDIFLQGKRDENENEGGNSSTANIMSAERKLEAIESLLGEIQKEVPAANIKEIKVNDNGTFDGYVIIPIAVTNVTIFENMNEDENAAIYIVDNGQIEHIVDKLTKYDAKQLPGVESANHTEDTKDDKTRFEGYKNRLSRKTKSILDYPEKAIQRKRVDRTAQVWLDRFERAKENMKTQK